MAGPFEYPLTDADLRTGVLWLLEVTWASEIFYFATDEVDILDADGNTLVYQGGLSIQFAEVMSLFNPSAAAPSLSINGLIFPVDVAELVAKGHPMVRAPVELSMHVLGETYEKRRVRFKGRMRLTDYDVEGTPIGFSVEPEGRGRDALLPDAAAQVSETTWPNADDEALGEHVPIVIGKPGLGKATVAGIRMSGGAPALVNDDAAPQLAISEGSIIAGNVVVIDTSAEARTTNNAVSTQTDALGRVFSVVGMDGAGEVAYVAGNSYMVDWSSTSGSADGGGGIRNPWGTGVLRGAGDVIRWAYNRAGVEVDHGRWVAIADTLNAFRIDTYIDDPQDLPRWVEKELLPLLPLAAVLQGPSGVYPVRWERNAGPTDVVADIDVHRDGLSSVGPVRYEDGQFGNELRINYGRRGDNGRPSRSRTMSGEDIGGVTSDVIPAQHLRASYLQHGRKVRKPLTTGAIRDNATALRILGWQAQAFAFPWRFVTYRDPAGNYGWLRPGDPVKLTHSIDGDDRHITDRVCWVAGVSWRDTTPTLTFALIDRPAADARPI